MFVLLFLIRDTVWFHLLLCDQMNWGSLFVTFSTASSFALLSIMLRRDAVGDRQAHIFTIDYKHCFLPFPSIS